MISVTISRSDCVDFTDEWKFLSTLSQKQMEHRLINTMDALLRVLTTGTLIFVSLVLEEQMF